MGIKEQLQLNNQQLQEHRDFIPTMPTAEEARNGQYTWHKYSVVDGKKGQSIGFVVDDSEMAYPMEGIHTDGFYYILYGIPLKVVTWADGTDEEIADMVKAADKGLIKLSDYWAVGQQRKVKLSPMGSEVTGHTQPNQTITLVLSHIGGKILSNGKECSFQVDLKNSLLETENFNTSATNTGGWKNSRLRTWCNSTFKNSFPEKLLPIFKSFKNNTGLGGGSSSGVEETEDYFALRAEIEIFGTAKRSVAGEGSQAQLYKTAANRKKKIGDDGALDYWWLRSPRSGYTDEVCCVIDSGFITSQSPTYFEGISPFGCI